MWLGNSEAFAQKYKITIKALPYFKGTAEHLLAKKEAGKDGESNIAAACHYCNQKRHKCKSPKDPLAYKHYVTKRLNKGKWNLGLMHKSDAAFKKSSIRKNVLRSIGVSTTI